MDLGASNGPRAATIEQHAHHATGSAGSECVACHMPKIAQTIADVNVRSFTCHTDKTPAWAAEALRTWPELSPWRVTP